MLILEIRITKLKQILWIPVVSCIDIVRHVHLTAPSGMTWE